jgi:hypothetical protein
MLADASAENEARGNLASPTASLGYMHTPLPGGRRRFRCGRAHRDARGGSLFLLPGPGNTHGGMGRATCGPIVGGSGQDTGDTLGLVE